MHQTKNYDSIVRYSRDYKTRRFGNWIYFRPQVKGRNKTPTQLGPLERAILNPMIEMCVIPPFYLRTETDPVS
jgi:hypothetical protein